MKVAPAYALIASLFFSPSVKADDAKKPEDPNAKVETVQEKKLEDRLKGLGDLLNKWYGDGPVFLYLWTDKTKTGIFSFSYQPGVKEKKEAWEPESDGFTIYRCDIQLDDDGKIVSKYGGFSIEKEWKDGKMHRFYIGKCVGDKYHIERDGRTWFCNLDREDLKLVKARFKKDLGDFLKVLFSYGG